MEELGGGDEKGAGVKGEGGEGDGRANGRGRGRGRGLWILQVGKVKASWKLREGSEGGPGEGKGEGIPAGGGAGPCEESGGARTDPVGKVCLREGILGECPRHDVYGVQVVHPVRRFYEYGRTFTEL